LNDAKQEQVTIAAPSMQRWHERELFSVPCRLLDGICWKRTRLGSTLSSVPCGPLDGSSSGDGSCSSIRWKWTCLGSNLFSVPCGPLDGGSDGGDGCERFAHHSYSRAKAEKTLQQGTRRFIAQLMTGVAGLVRGQRVMRMQDCNWRAVPGPRSGVRAHGSMFSCHGKHSSPHRLACLVDHTCAITRCLVPPEPVAYWYGVKFVRYLTA